MITNIEDLSLMAAEAIIVLQFASYEGFAARRQTGHDNQESIHLADAGNLEIDSEIHKWKGTGTHISAWHSSIWPFSCR